MIGNGAVGTYRSTKDALNVVLYGNKRMIYICLTALALYVIMMAYGFRDLSEVDGYPRWGLAHVLLGWFAASVTTMAIVTL